MRKHRRVQDDSAIDLLQRALEAFAHVQDVEAKNAEVFYWKGICQLRLAANGLASYKDVAAEFQSYLKLAPHGRFAAEVKRCCERCPMSKQEMGRIGEDG